MQGLELSELYYNNEAKQILSDQFSDILPFLCVGLLGSGSECYGFDDEISRDHDFEPGFCIFLPDEEFVDRKTAFKLERFYSKLPKEFMGFQKSLIDPVGGARHGVFRTKDFFLNKIGSSDGFLTVEQWLKTPEHFLSEATNGKIFFDNYGEVTEIRYRLYYYPDDIKKKKLAGNLLLAAQSGQYNYLRCLKHGENAAAQLAVFEFVKSIINVIFIFNNRYQPFYKWKFKSLRNLDILSYEAELLECLMVTDNTDFEEKNSIMEGIVCDIVEELQNQKLTKAICTDLEKHAYSVNDSIEDSNIRNMNILAAV